MQLYKKQKNSIIIKIKVRILNDMGVILWMKI